MIVLDNSVFLYFIQPSADPPLDPSTGHPVERCKERLDRLIADLSKSGKRLLLPTPVITEALVSTGTDAASFLNEIRRHSVFRIADFDQRAAIECSIMIAQHWHGRLKQLRSDVSRHRIKFDLQIVAIARVASAHEILTDDPDVKKVAAITGMAYRGIADLPLPDKPDQYTFPGL